MPSHRSKNADVSSVTRKSLFSSRNHPVNALEGFVFVFLASSATCFKPFSTFSRNVVQAAAARFSTKSFWTNSLSKSRSRRGFLPKFRLLPGGVVVVVVVLKEGGGGKGGVFGLLLVSRFFFRVLAAERTTTQRVTADMDDDDTMMMMACTPV
jgi:hypothetical protein